METISEVDVMADDKTNDGSEIWDTARRLESQRNTAIDALRLIVKTNSSEAFSIAKEALANLDIQP